MQLCACLLVDVVKKMASIEHLYVLFIRFSQYQIVRREFFTNRLAPKISSH